MLLQHKGTLPARSSRITGESTAGPASGSGTGPGGGEWGVDMALLWSVPRSGGAPPRVGVHHLYNLQMEVRGLAGGGCEGGLAGARRCTFAGSLMSGWSQVFLSLG